MEADLRAPDWATHLISDLHGWRHRPLPVTDLGPFDLPDDAWFEYAWLDAEGEARADPEGVPAENPWWDYACRLVGPAWRVAPDVPDAATRSRGRLRGHRLDSRHLGPKRRIYVYSPAGADTSAPALLIHDGKGFWHHGRCGPLADALLAAGRIRPAHLVFLQPESRSKEYFFNPAHRAYVVEEVLPFLERTLALAGRPSLLGASLGGLAAADLALAHPDLFRAVGSLSGAFLMGPQDDPPDPFAGSEWLLSRIRAGAGRELAWFLDCGTLEWLHPAHERLCAALDAGGHRHACVSRNVGHNWTGWRNALPGMLARLLGTE